MTSVRPAKRYGLATKASLGALCISWLLFGTYPASLVPHTSWRFPIQLLTFALFALVGGVIAWKAATSFRCPECKAPIGRSRNPNQDADRSLQFYCKTCDVIWDT